MQPKTNPIARQLSSVPQTHRDETLSAISKQIRDVTARVELSQAEADRMQQLLKNVPADVTSRLAWLNAQLVQF